MIIQHIKSRIDGKDLHMIIRGSCELEESERVNVVPDNEFIQLSVLNLPEGRTFKPHKHVLKQHNLQAIAQESWVVLKGSVKVILYDIDDSILCEEVLRQHDVSITLRGGHNYLILEEDTKVLEYKTGPYQGQALDKVFI